MLVIFCFINKLANLLISDLKKENHCIFFLFTMEFTFAEYDSSSHHKYIEKLKPRTNFKLYYTFYIKQIINILPLF